MRPWSAPSAPSRPDSGSTRRLPRCTPCSGTISATPSTAASFEDLNPNDRFVESEITAMRGLVYVGFGKSLTQQERNQAILWHHNYPVNAWMNLHARLPYPFTFWNSYATDIDNQGNVQNPMNGQRRPVVWEKVV